MVRVRSLVQPALDDLAPWLVAWNVEGYAADTPEDAQFALDRVVHAALNSAVQPWLRPFANPHDDALLSYSVRSITDSDQLWVMLPGFSAVPIPVNAKAADDPAGLLRGALQLRIDSGAPIPEADGTASASATLQVLDDRTCRIARLHQGRLELGLTVARFCRQLDLPQDYFKQMLQLDDDTIPLPTIIRVLAAVRDMLPPQVPQGKPLQNSG
jgi:hypothetical protein